MEYAHKMDSMSSSQLVTFNKPNSSISDTLKSMQNEQIWYEYQLCFMYIDGRFGAVGVGLDLTKKQTYNMLK